MLLKKANLKKKLILFTELLITRMAVDIYQDLIIIISNFPAMTKYLYHSTVMRIDSSDA